MTNFTDRFSLSMLGAMMCLPFLVPIHLAPISSFYPEWLACILGLAAVPVVLSSRVQWPAVGYLPLLLTGIVLVQTVTGSLPYRETGLLAMLYLLWAALVMAIAATLKQRLGLEAVAEHLAMWLLAGAMLNAIAGFLALNGVGAPWVMSPDSRAAIYGNLAQPNQFAHQMWLGIASALFLAASPNRRLGTPRLLAILVILLPAAALSGSRAGLLYAFWLVTAGAFWSGLGGASRRIAVAVAYLACTAILPPWVGWGEATPVARTVAEVTSGGDLRPMLFLVGWKMFIASPWLGAGFGSFSHQSFSLAAGMPGWAGTGEHAHNLVAQLLGELGVFAALGTGLMVLAWGRRVLATRNEPTSGWLVALVGITLIHSLVEYPLWYAYFLGIFAVVLALGDNRTRALRLGRLAFAAPVFFGSVIGVLLVRDYLLLQKLSIPIAAGNSIEPFRERNLALAGLRKGSLMKPYVDLTLAAAMLPSRTELAAKAALCRRTLRFRPTVPPAFSCALVYELAGEHGEAQILWMLADRASPGYVPKYLAWMGDALDEKERSELRPFVARATGRHLP